MGPQRAPRRRRGGAYRGRAPLEPRPLAARRQSHRRQAALCPRSRGWHARYGGGRPLDRPEDEDGGRRPRLERARHYKPGRAAIEAGTMNIAQVVGLGAAVEYLEGLSMENVREHERRLGEYAYQRLSELEEITIHGPTENRTGIASFTLPDVHPHDLSQLLDEEGIAIRSGHHCTQPLMRRLGVAATARASFYLYNTQEEVDRLADALVRAREFFGAFA